MLQKESEHLVLQKNAENSHLHTATHGVHKNYMVGTINFSLKIHLFVIEANF